MFEIGSWARLRYLFTLEYLPNVKCFLCVRCVCLECFGCSIEGIIRHNTGGVILDPEVKELSLYDGDRREILSH